ncbi:hypothetical protein HDV06_005964 [Boothiomyces sp. JEL0866]|nr:hypothetical protein HDV06_005964 [Boothiomyces sp. JEL0866]
MVAVIELFTSEGCSSCPPADELMFELKDVITLSYHVDYWDYLGWKDPFSSKQWTNRQLQYKEALGSRSMYTPQAVINGRVGVVGSKKHEIHHTVSHSDLQLDIKIKDGCAYLERSDESIQILQVVFEKYVQVHVSAGENRGKTLHHRNVVKSITDLGRGSRLQLKSTLANEGICVLAQDRISKAILGADIKKSNHNLIGMTLHHSRVVQISVIGFALLAASLLFKKKKSSPHERYFSKDYYSARDKFRAASNGKGKTYHLQITEKHTADILVHGVEGFAGSAIQLAVLDKFGFGGHDHPTVVFVHAVNPYGMAESRRWNENGVDLNRNYLTKEEFAALRQSDANAHGYVNLYDMLNPKYVPSAWNDFFYIKSLYYILKYGYLSVKRAIVSGNYHFDQSLFFGGFELQKSHVLLSEFLKKHIDADAVKKLAFLDIHTGLGPSGFDTLMVEQSGLDILNAKSVDEEFLSHAVPLGDANDDASSGYDTVKGTAIAGLQRLFNNTDFNALVTQEFGTVSNLAVFRALRAEAAAFRLKTNDRKVYGKAVRDVFYSSNDPKWKTSVVERGLRVFEQVYNSLNE